MHPDLEALINAYDAALEASPADAPERIKEFDECVQNVLSRTGGLSEDGLRNAVRLAHCRWLAKQRKPPILPPNA